MVLLCLTLVFQQIMPAPYTTKYSQQTIHTYSLVKVLGLVVMLFFISLTDVSAQYAEGFKITREGDLYGFTNEDGKVVIPPVYEKVYDFSDGRARVKSGKWGLIDRYGTLVIPTLYDSITQFTSGDVIIDSAGKKGLMSNSGRALCAPVYDDILVWYGLFMVKLSGKWGMIDRAGEIIQPIVYDGPPIMSLYELKMKKDNITYTIDYKGEFIK